MSKKRAEHVVSIRLEPGMADELRAYTNLPISRLARELLKTFLAQHKRKRLEAIAAHKESNDVAE